MFKKASESNGREKLDSSINLISNDSEIKGDLTSKGDIRIDGIIHGNIVSQSKVVIGSTGKVYGNITCLNSDISGLMKGDMTVTEILTLKSTANVEGDMTVFKLIVEPGAVFNGRCNMNAPAKGKEIAEVTKK